MIFHQGIYIGEKIYVFSILFFYPLLNKRKKKNGGDRVYSTFYIDVLSFFIAIIYIIAEKFCGTSIHFYSILLKLYTLTITTNFGKIAHFYIFIQGAGRNILRICSSLLRVFIARASSVYSLANLR